MSIEIGTTLRDGATVLSIRGEIDISSTPQLLAAVALLDEAARRRLVVDLGGVDFLDSSGLGALVGVQKEVAGAGGRLVLACAQPTVQRVFAITKLTEVIDVVDSVDDAVAVVNALRD